MKQIVEDIKNEDFKQIYLLYGVEEYLKRLYKNKLKTALIGTEDTMNYQYFEGKNINVNEVIDLAETLPFFADRRLIIIENSGLFKGEGQKLADYIKEMSVTTHFVFVESEVDKRSRLYKTVKEKGQITELIPQDEKHLLPWIIGILNKENKKITEKTMSLFLNRTGTDMENISREIEKLICYTLGRDVITSEDVEEIVTTRVTNQIFDMVNEIANRNQKKAMELYYDLLALKEPPMRILYLITRQFNLLLQVKDMVGHGFGNGEISKKTGLPGFVIRKYITQSNSFTLQQLKEAIELCVISEEEVKTGRLNDVMSVELLIVRYSRI